MDIINNNLYLYHASLTSTLPYPDPNFRIIPEFQRLRHQSRAAVQRIVWNGESNLVKSHRLFLLNSGYPEEKITVKSSKTLKLQNLSTKLCTAIRITFTFAAKTRDIHR